MNPILSVPIGHKVKLVQPWQKPGGEISQKLDSPRCTYSCKGFLSARAGSQEYFLSLNPSHGIVVRYGGGRLERKKARKKWCVVKGNHHMQELKNPRIYTAIGVHEA